MKKLRLLLISFVLVFLLISGSGREDKVDQIIQVQTDKIFKEIVKIRRDIHQYPELGGQEKRTSAVVIKKLRSLGIEVIPNIGGYGVLGILRGKLPGPVIGWRADMDALTFHSPENSEFASKIPGVRHICGHDVHTAIALGIAKVLSSIRDKLKGTVVFIFQPSEENFSGARAMIKDGLFDKVKPEAIFALHITPLPYNRISVKPGEMFAYRKVSLILELDKPLQAREGMDQLTDYILSQSTHTLEELTRASLGSEENSILSPGTPLRDYLFIPAKSIAVTRSADSAEFRAELFSSSKKNILDLIARIKASEFKDHILKATYSSQFWQRPVVNDPELTATAVKKITALFGKETVLRLYGITPSFNDDFALFQEKVPGVYFFLGGSNQAKGITSMPHSPGFAIDDECIRTGINYFSSLLFGFSKN